MTYIDRSTEVAAKLANVFKTQGFLAATKELHRLAAEDRAKFGPWIGYRVFGVDVQPAADGLARILVYCDAVTVRRTNDEVFEFMVGVNGDLKSERLNALLLATGLRDRVEDVREIEGRYFSARNDGKRPDDFESLELALNQPRPH